MKTARLHRRHAIIALALTVSLPAVSAAEQWYKAVGVGGPVVDVVVQGSTGNVIAAVQGSNPGIYRSTDMGTTFTKVKSFTSPFRLVDWSGLVFAATSQGLYTSSDLTNWTAITDGLPSGQSVSYVGQIRGDLAKMYVTVASGVSRGLYRRDPITGHWTLVLPNADIEGVAMGMGGAYQTVFAGGNLSSGGPPCTLSKSTDGGITWGCTTFAYPVNDVWVNSIAYNVHEVYVTCDSANSVYRSTDLGSTFALDNVGMPNALSSNIFYGTTVGTLGFGIYTRGLGGVGTPWTQFDINGLTNKRINRWLYYPAPPPAPYFVAATPVGVFYYGTNPPPCGTPPCP